jgi:NAD(P)-dependent dehydrogenase (short-subunit alcohol dehydrogenase family)
MAATLPRSAALVTGCSTGIGRATALALHAAGHSVYATSRQVASLNELADLGLRVLPLDVTDESSMSSAVDTVAAEHGSVGVLVNNAGYSLQGSIEETSLEDVRAQFETNVFGLVRLCQLVLPGMRAHGAGTIVNMGSMGGRFTFPGGGFYHASKHAVEAVTDALRLEVSAFGVRVVLIEPGPVQTAFGDTAVSTIAEQDEDGAGGPYDQFNRELAARYASAYDGRSGRLAVSAEDVARVVVRAVHSRHPRPRYAVGAVAKGMIAGRRLAPDVVWDRFMRAQWPTP